eukprot:128340_1
MSDLSSHDSSLDTTDSPSIYMDNKHTLNLSHSFCKDLKPESTVISTSTHLRPLNTPNIATSSLFAMNNLDDLLFNTPTTTTDNAVANQMDFLMMDLTQQSSSAHLGANINITSPVLDFQNTINITPSLNALTHGLFEMGSNPNTPHLPPLNIEDANSQQTASHPHEYDMPLAMTTTMPAIPAMPIVNGIGDNIPPPTQDLDWQTFCNLIQQNNTNSNSNNSSNTNSSDKDRKRKSNPFPASPSKKRKLNNTKKETKPKRKKRGRPRKNPEKVNIKKEKKKSKKSIRTNDEDYDHEMDEYLNASYGAESYVGIRTDDGEVRIQIPTNPKTDDDCSYNKVKFTVFGNACSDKIEDILQPKKRTRYVRGLSEEEKKTRRREQNRNAAARSRARKNAMISKVIQLHNENMGLRAFVAENITQTKILRDEINRLNKLCNHLLSQQPQPQQQPTQSSLFDIINQDSSTLFQTK